MNTSTPEHDDLCESGDPEYMTTACRCEDRRTNAGIDPRLLKMRVKRVRQAETALAAVKRVLVTYISEHAATTCQTKRADGSPFCKRATDGVMLVSCGHFEFMCAEHASIALRSSQGALALTCTITDDGLHEHPAVGVTLEWCGL